VGDDLAVVEYVHHGLWREQGADLVGGQIVVEDFDAPGVFAVEDRQGLAVEFSAGSKELCAEWAAVCGVLEARDDLGVVHEDAVDFVADLTGEVEEASGAGTCCCRCGLRLVDRVADLAGKLEASPLVWA